MTKSAYAQEAYAQLKGSDALAELTEEQQGELLRSLSTARSEADLPAQHAAKVAAAKAEKAVKIQHGKE